MKRNFAVAQNIFSCIFRTPIQSNIIKNLNLRATIKTEYLKIFLLLSLQLTFYVYYKIFRIFAFPNVGPNLPFNIRNSTMVTSPNGEGVILIGGYNASLRIHSDLLLGTYSNYKSIVSVYVHNYLKYTKDLFLKFYTIFWFMILV